GRDLHLRHRRHAVIALETRRAAGEQLFGAKRRHRDELVGVEVDGTRDHCELLQAMVRDPLDAGGSEQLPTLARKVVPRAGVCLDWAIMRVQRMRALRIGFAALLGVSWIMVPIRAQAGQSDKTARAERRLPAVRASAPIKIDGALDEAD